MLLIVYSDDGPRREAKVGVMGQPKERYETDAGTSRRMSAVRPLDTTPEKIVQRVLRSFGYRYGLHRYDLPGRPDIVIASRRKAIFVHGCFWHRHPGCHRTTMPKRNEHLWQEKFRRTLERDQQKRRLLEEAGWQVLVVWECETANEDCLAEVVQRFVTAK